VLLLLQLKLALLKAPQPFSYAKTASSSLMLPCSEWVYIHAAYEPPVDILLNEGNPHMPQFRSFCLSRVGCFWLVICKQRSV
jgi:hypothetical protein